MRLARNGATMLTPAELANTLDPLRAAARALREGVATELDWSIVASAFNVAQAIEQQGVVRGLGEHFRSAELALHGIEQRAMASGEWKATALYYQELDHINTAVDLHEFQLRRLSFSEVNWAVKKAVSEVRSTGGRIITPAAQKAEMLQEAFK
ncbi:hypothetical protein GmRootV15_28170 [Variovorax sp. V15]